MKLTVLLSLFAVAVVAEDVFLAEADLDARDERLAMIEARSPIAARGTSSKCAAHVSTNQRRDLESLDWAYDTTVEKRQVDSTCQSYGYVSNPGPRVFIKNIKEQRCANTCVCRPKTTGQETPCKSFTFQVNPDSDTGRGQCILYTKEIEDMGFQPGESDDGTPSRAFQARNCYKKGEPLPTAVQTAAKLKARATPPPTVKRDDAFIVDALAGF